MTHSRLTVEKLANGSIDVSELHRAGLLAGDWVTLQPSFRWPGITTMRIARFRIVIELRDQSAPQSVRVSWTRCHYGGVRPWLHCPHCQRRVARLFKGLGAHSDDCDHSFRSIATTCSDRSRPVWRGCS